jgi:hypothetical protein
MPVTGPLLLAAGVLVAALVPAVAEVKTPACITMEHHSYDHCLP